MHVCIVQTYVLAVRRVPYHPSTASSVWWHVCTRVQCACMVCDFASQIGVHTAMPQEDADLGTRRHVATARWASLLRLDVKMGGDGDVWPGNLLQTCMHGPALPLLDVDAWPA